MTEAQQKAYWRKYAKQNAKMERLAYRIMMRAISAGLQPVINAIQEIGPDQTLAQLDGLFSRNAIKQAYEQLYYAVGVAHKKWTDQDVKTRFPKKKEEDDRFRRRPNPDNVRVDTNIGLGFFNPAWLARLKQIVNGLDVAQRVTSVTDTIRKQIKDSIQQSQQEFVSIRKITARLRKDVGETFSRQRSEVIARTEVTYIANIAAEQSAKETGLKLVKTWIHTRDNRTRDAHRNVPTKPIKAEEKFIVGGVKMDKPGDPAGGIKNCVNCRCSVAYLPEDDYEDLFNDQGEFL